MPIPSAAQYAVVAASDLGDNTLVAAVVGRQIRVLAFTIVASGGLNTVRFESAAGGTPLTGLMDLAADGQLIVPYNPAGWFQTDAGDLLNLELSAATLVAGFLVYMEIS